MERPCEKKLGSEERQQKSSEQEQEQELCEQDREESNRLCLEGDISDSSVRQSEDNQHRKKPWEFPDWTEDDISRKQGHKC